MINVILGNRGTGKTQLAVEVIRTACKMHFPSKYTKAMDIFLNLRSSMDDRTISEISIINKYYHPKVLVIDAMEERSESAWENRVLNHIIDKRYDDNKDTILISNQTKETLSKSLGTSIVSRIHETGKVFECDWRSFRN